LETARLKYGYGLRNISTRVRMFFALACGLLLAPLSSVQAELAICTTPQRPSCPEALARPGEQEFTFSRLIFADNQRAIEDLGDRIGYPHWQADCSESEPHFISALQRLTHLDLVMSKRRTCGSTSTGVVS